MCQLVVKPAGVSIKRSILHDAWMQNDDGAGFAYRDASGQIMLAKGYFKFKKFYAAYLKVEHFDMLIHFRFATDGDKVAENCHPFVVGEQVVLGHNGVLWSYRPTGQDTRSDTRIFCETVVQPALRASAVTPTEFFSNPATKALFETATRGNKFVILEPNGFHIMNESAGTWKDKVWYSAGYPPEQNWMRDCYPYQAGFANWSDWYNTKYVKNIKVQSQEIFEGDEEYYSGESDIPHISSTTAVKTVQGYGSVEVESRSQYCEVCQEPSSRLYTVGKEQVCPECWKAFTQED